MKQQLEAIRKAALEAIADAAKAEDLEALRVRYLGKKGELTAVLKQMGKLSAEERPVIGQLANEVRAALEAGIEKKASELADKAMECKLKEEAVDVFHFAVSVALAAGMDARELFERYQSKNRENIARQQGLSGKPGYDVHELEP